MRFTVPERLTRHLHFIAWRRARCVVFIVTGCNAIAGIEVPSDKPNGDAAPNDGLDSRAETEAPADGPRPTCSQSSQTFQDPNTGVAWTPVWYCGNNGGATIFEAASYATPIGRMQTATSWYACYRHGELHQGGNDVWYYTQGDETLPGWEARKAWGYMPAADVYTSTDPFPGIVECTANP